MQHLATHQTDILIRLALRCDDVSAQEGDLVSVRTGHTRQLDLRLDIEPVPRLGLNGRRPAACHFVEDPGHDGVEEPHGSLPSAPNSAQNPASLVPLPVHPRVELIAPVTGENRVAVRVDETWYDAGSGHIGLVIGRRSLC